MANGIDALSGSNQHGAVCNYIFLGSFIFETLRTPRKCTSWRIRTPWPAIAAVTLRIAGNLGVKTTPALIPMGQRTSRSKVFASPARPAEASTPEGGTPALHGKTLIELITAQWQRERGDLDLSNFLLAIYLMRLGTIIERSFGRLCEQRYGISGSDMRVLFALRRGSPPYVKRPTDLFRALLVTSGAITKKVDRLEALNLVERLQDPGHLGGFLVRLTKKGVQTADQMVETLATESVIAPAMEQFSRTEREQGSRFALAALSALETLGLDTPDDTGAAKRSKGSKRGRGS
jgi:DNA-binding MarR family transcriptional regulator